MGTFTTNYALFKPALTDPADITAMNSNWDMIDRKFKSIANNYADVNNRLGIANKFNATDIADETNLNSITTAGVYRCQTTATASTLINTPTNLAFAMMVLQHSSTGVTQILYEYSTSSPKIYFRNKHSTTWSSWSELTNKLPLSGGTINGTVNFAANGNLQAVGKYRLFNGTSYLATFGCGGYNNEGVAALEIRRGSTNALLGRLEVGADGIFYVDKNNKRYSMVSGVMESRPSTVDTLEVTDNGKKYLSITVDSSVRPTANNDGFSFIILATLSSNTINGIKVNYVNSNGVVDRVYYKLVTKKYNNYEMLQQLYPSLAMFMSGEYVRITLSRFTVSDSEGTFPMAYIENPNFENYLDYYITTNFNVTRKG